ncbi:MAG TPA: DEAD/DEAH box helicase family protein, partial [Ignavibacteria bacterium]
IAAAVIKLFLRTGNAKRVLFLVDRLELEDQANKAFKEYLKNDYKCIIYKENRDDWRRAEIVVTTVQSLQVNNKYQNIFSPTDFDLIISDEAHRSIGGNSRAVFEYFIGYKLGLTATPKDYLKKIDSKKLNEKDPRQYERRLLLDTYKTFGCESGQPTFRYSLIDGVKDGYLINPHVVDARTEITTEMLSEKGYSVMKFTDEGEEVEDIFFKRDFEKRFISEETNKVFCETFLKNALKDPISREIGKSIMYCVSQNHAAKITQILNVLADKMFPGKYKSDFALQVTSRISDAQQFSINFSNNKLSGQGNFIEEYKTSKTRVCVTVGMMTTGYDCTDILNLCMLRPIFSPTDFIQMKGRGTRKHKFTINLFNKEIEEQVINPDKKIFKLFDFFANCEYFEEEYNYDEIIELPVRGKKGQKGEPPLPSFDFENFKPDPLKVLEEKTIGYAGMKIDRMFFQSFETKLKEDEFVVKNVEEGRWDSVIDYVSNNLLNKPEEFYTLEKLRKAINIDRRITLREVLEKIFGFINYFKSKDELLNEEFNKFIVINKPDSSNDIPALKYYFRAYLTDEKLREIIDKKKLNDLYTNPSFDIEHYKAIGKNWRHVIPEYIKDYVSINQFIS